VVSCGALHLAAVTSNEASMTSRRPQPSNTPVSLVGGAPRRNRTGDPPPPWSRTRPAARRVRNRDYTVYGGHCRFRYPSRLRWRTTGRPGRGGADRPARPGQHTGERPQARLGQEPGDQRLEGREGPGGAAGREGGQQGGQRVGSVPSGHRRRFRWTGMSRRCSSRLAAGSNRDGCSCLAGTG
jgi:hypothetical protein